MNFSQNTRGWVHLLVTVISPFVNMRIGRPKLDIPLRAYQGHRFVTEAVSCLRTYAFEQLRLYRIVEITDCENAAFIALLERFGMRHEGPFLQNICFIRTSALKENEALNLSMPSFGRSG